MVLEITQKKVYGSLQSKDGDYGPCVKPQTTQLMRVKSSTSYNTDLNCIPNNIIYYHRSGIIRISIAILSGFISSLPQLAWEKKAMLLLLLLSGIIRIGSRKQY